MFSEAAVKTEPGTSQGVVATINGWPQGDCWVLSALIGKMGYQLCPAQLPSTLLPLWWWQGGVGDGSERGEPS